VNGARSVRALVDLYGRNGFDVLCVTDELVRVPEGMPRPPVDLVHGIEHLRTWKTLLPCAKEEAAVIDYLRSQRPAYFVDLARFDGLRAAA
jgi:hypothetical protein